MNRTELNKFKLPDSPGIYYYRDSRERILYIGKATSLRDRVRSYFLSNLTDSRSTAIATMIEEASSVTWQTTDSVLEALILEANEIKKHQPKYNAREKDDKSFNYLVITKEDFPRVLVIRGRELFSPLSTKCYPLSAIYGPYPQGRSLAEALKIVRKIFPFRDKCTPCDSTPHASLPVYSRELTGKERRVKRGNTSQARSHLACRPCFNRQIGLCPGVCGGEINKKEYARTIRHIKTLFSGKLKTLKQTLEKEMRAESKAERFENAAKLRRQIHALNHIRDVSLIKDDPSTGSTRLTTGLLRAGSTNSRIEAYDVAHTSGVETVAVMVVVNNGEPEKESYRKFKIKTARNDDIGTLKEVLSRRLAHSEWPLPRVIVVDGGKAQIHAASRVLTDSGVSIPIVGVVKNVFHRPERLIGDATAIKACEKEILLANSEAHRFAISFHRKRRRASMI